MTDLHNEHLEIAEVLWSTLQRMNKSTFMYSLDTINEDGVLSPYAHVRHALQDALDSLVDDDKERSAQLFNDMCQNHEDVEFNLRYLREEWEMKPRTVGELKEFLDKYPDTMPIALVDNQDGVIAPINEITQYSANECIPSRIVFKPDQQFLLICSD